MTAPTGPVFISLPGSVLDQEAELDLGHPTRVDTATRPTDEALQALARRLLQAERPVIIAGRELAEHQTLAEACELAELLGAPVYQEPVPYNARFPSEHPACMGDLTRNQAKVRQTLSPHDLLLCLGADLLRMSPYSPVDPLPDGLPVVHLSEREAELGKNYPTELALRADVKATLKALLPVLQAARSPVYAAQAARRMDALATTNWSARRAKASQTFAALATQQPIDQRYLVLKLVEALPERVIVVDETLTAAPALAALLPMSDAHSYYGLASGGLGHAMPGAVGVALAHPGRPVVAVMGDGSAMYSIQALWTAAHLKLPITYVIINNRGYRIIKERLKAGRGSERFVGMDMDDPPLDFAALAQGMGMASRSVRDPADIEPALAQAFASGQANLVEVMVDKGFNA